MRVNVYGEELTSRIEVVQKEAEGHTFYGLRFWLKFPNQDWWLHRKVGGEWDDDSSAVTIWAETQTDLDMMLNRALDALNPTAD